MAAFWLAELIRIVPLRTVLLISPWGGRARLQPAAGGLVLADRRRAILAPLLPLGTLLPADSWPLGYAEGRLGSPPLPLAPEPEPEAWQCELSSADLAAEGRQLVLGARRVGLATPTAAAAWRDQVGALAAAPPEHQAEGYRQFLERTLAPTSASELTVQLERLRPLRVFAALQLLATFVLFPTALWLALPIPPLLLLGGLLFPHLVTVLAFAFTHRALWPGRTRKWIGDVIGVLLSPGGAMAAPQRLAFDFVGAIHPLALARELASPAEWRELAARALAGARHAPFPLGPGADLASEVLTAYVRECGEDPDRLGSLPPEGDSPAAWCRYCRSVFRRPPECCPECGGQVAA